MANTCERTRLPRAQCAHCVSGLPKRNEDRGFFGRREDLTIERITVIVKRNSPFPRFVRPYRLTQVGNSAFAIGNGGRDIYGVKTQWGRDSRDGKFSL